MTVPAEALSPQQVRRLLDSVLTRPAEEGARILALFWLHQLLEARSAWRSALQLPVEPERPSDAAPEARAPLSPDSSALLHKARVNLRRLRATLRENHRVLDDAVDRRTLRALRRLGQDTGEARDLDVHRAWLDANLEVLPPDGREEATRLQARLDRRQHVSALDIERAFAKRLDPFVDDLFSALGTYRLRFPVGVHAAPVSLARHLASVLQRSGERLRRDLEHVRDIDRAELTLHALRIRLKRQRALLSPFVKVDRRIGAWFTRATRGQDQLGAMRDAMLLSQRARRHGLARLEATLRDQALSYHAAFVADWVPSEAPLALLAEARAALLAQDRPRDASSGLPLEIERKYLLRACPPAVRAVASTRIEQGWLPGKALKERLRRRTDPDGTVTCWRTIKLGPVEARIEVEEATAPELFESLWPLTRRARVRKDRFTMPEGNHHWEIDVFLDRQLVLAEIELQSMNEVVTPPAWLAPYIVRDVTGESAYFNSELARPDA